MKKFFKKIYELAEKCIEKIMKNNPAAVFCQGEFSLCVRVVELLKENNIKQALFKKELKRFLASPTYMLNSALGAPIMIIAGVILLVKSAKNK